MGKHYEHLDIASREKLYELLQKGYGVKVIAEKLCYHKSTLYRELNRNKTRIGYLPDSAQKLADKRHAKPLKIEGNPELKNSIISRLMGGWSPEQIAGFLQREKGIKVISHETIYAYIYSRKDKDNSLHLCLRKRRKRRRARVGCKAKRISIPNRTSIHARPAEIEEREAFGHWEGDLMLFSDQRNNLITLRERKSRFFIAIKNPNKMADTTAENIIKKFRGQKKTLIETLTLDNGGEFASHEKIQKCLRIDTFFCDPYSSYQKGSIENGNGVLRYDLPRSTNLENLSQKAIDKIVSKINNRPMKCLGFNTPAEVFQKHYSELIGDG